MLAWQAGRAAARPCKGIRVVTLRWSITRLIRLTLYQGAPPPSVGFLVGVRDSSLAMLKVGTTGVCVCLSVVGGGGREDGPSVGGVTMEVIQCLAGDPGCPFVMCSETLSST